MRSKNSAASRPGNDRGGGRVAGPSPHKLDITTLNGIAKHSVTCSTNTHCKGVSAQNLDEGCDWWLRTSNGSWLRNLWHNGLTASLHSERSSNQGTGCTASIAMYLIVVVELFHELSPKHCGCTIQNSRPGSAMGQIIDSIIVSLDG